MRKFLAMILIILFVPTLVACGGGAAPASPAAPPAPGGTTQPEAPPADAPLEQVTLRWAELSGPAAITTRAARVFADEVYAISDGAIVVEVFDSMVLGDEASTMQSLQMGAVDFFRGSALTLGDFGASMMNIFGLPFVFTGMDHMWEVLESPIGDQMLANVQASDTQMVGVSWFGMGARHFMFTENVSSLEEMSGLRVRVPQTQLMIDMVESLDANATAISFAELYSALQTGVVEGMENPLSSYLNNSFYEVAPYVLLSSHNVSALPILASEMTWNSLSEAHRTLILQALDVAYEWIKNEADADDLWAYNELIDRGVVIHSVPDFAPWQEAVAWMYEEYGADYIDVINAIIAMG